MLLKTARVTKFRSIEDSTPVDIDPAITALVGRNESGKTAFLQALHKCAPVEDGIALDVTEDYPRHELLEYEASGEVAQVAVLTFDLEEPERAALAAAGIALPPTNLQITHRYTGARTIALNTTDSERAFLDAWRSENHFAAGVGEKLEKLTTVEKVVATLSEMDLNEADGATRDALVARFPATEWHSRYLYRCWMLLAPYVPKFMYFDDYRILPGKVNIPDLIARKKNGKLDYAGEGVLRLLGVAGIDIEVLAEPGGYERGQARLEATSTAISRKVFKYWQQNRDLRVSFDVKPDPSDAPPYNAGLNLYIRVLNPQHGVTVAFDRRSKGFIWFFSFIAWFDSVARNLSEQKHKVILLLDEPGLSLHALAQADYLRYMEHLSASNQIVYTTHSPFMIDSTQLIRARTVEDRRDAGTVVSSHMGGSSSDTLFPLQAALGYSIAQNLFVSKRNLIVEGVSELVLLQAVSARLEAAGRQGLDESITITPVGGIKKVASFVALFGASDLEIAVLHDYDGRQEQSLEELIREKLLTPRQVLHFASFRDAGSSGTTEKLVPTDLEDLIPRALYLKGFNETFKQSVKVGDLGGDPRIVVALERYLEASSIQLRPSGGFNHFLVAQKLAATGWQVGEAELFDRFERVFHAVNRTLVGVKSAR